MLVEIFTIFPTIIEGFFNRGIVHQAIKKGALRVEIVDLRDFTTDRHRTVDDRPFGGGEGMVLKPEPVFAAVEARMKEDPAKPLVALLSPQGRRFDQKQAKELSLEARLMLICGRYEGVDQRVADHLADREISLGDFVLSGGEVAAAAIVDAVCRLVPRVLGDSRSALRESFMEGLLDYPQYTRPADFRGWKVPDVLLSGDHEAIETWRAEQALRRTRKRRPDLLEPGEQS